jgi:hypothetical protein
MAERAIQAFSDCYFSELALPKGGPILHLLACSKAEAADALLRLIDVDAGETNIVRALQNKIQLHRLLLSWIEKTINEGEQIYAQMSIDEREGMQMSVLTSTGDTTMVDD